MRRLIASFMLMTVGREWVDETLPGPVQEAVRKSKRKESPRDYLNVLHTVDFVHLGEFLFTAYSKRTPQELYGRLKDAKTVDDLVAVQEECLPKSNWARYFKAVVDCDDSYLTTRWTKLYDLRCKVAHNALVTRRDLDDIRTLVGEVRPKIQDAIAKLSNVTVPTDELELVAERAAGSVNASLGEFVTEWQELESAIEASISELGLSPQRRGRSPMELVRLGVFPPEQIQAYEELRRFRNRVVHGPTADVPLETIQGQVAALRTLQDEVDPAPYVGYLRALPRDDLEKELGARIDSFEHEIEESEAFASAVAETNASGFTIDQWEFDDIELNGDECVVTINFYASGDQNPEQMHAGDKIRGQAILALDGHRQLTCREITAEVDHGDAAEAG